MSKTRALLFFIFVVASFIAACSKDESTNLRPDSVSYDLELSPLKPSDMQKLPNNKQAMEFIQNVNSGKELSFERVTRFFILKQTEKFEFLYKTQNSYYVSDSFLKNQMPQDHYLYLESLFKPLSKKNFFELKNLYELEIKKRSGQNISLDWRSVYTPSVQYNTNLHVQSSAHLNMLGTRMSRSGFDYQKENYVMVFQNGAMKHGRFLKIANQWVLFTVDGSSDGDGIERIGVSSDLQGCIRIVDADYYAFAMSIMDYLKPNSRSDLVSDIEDLTAEKYGIDLDIQDLTICEKASHFPFGPEVSAANETDLLPKYFSIGFISYKKSKEDRKNIGMSFQRAQDQIRSEEISFRQKEQCTFNKNVCAMLPPSGTAKARFYIRKPEGESFDVPYVFEAKKDEKMLFAPTRAYAILVPEGQGTIFYDQIPKQCELVGKVIKLSQKGTNVLLFRGDNYEFLEVNLKYGENHISAGEFSIPLNGFRGGFSWYSSSLSGRFSISDLDLLTFDGHQKQKIEEQEEVVQSYVIGTSSLVSKEKIRQIRDQCRAQGYE